MKRIHVFFIFLSSVLSCLSQDNQYAFLNINYSPRIAALGGRNVSLSSENINNISDNPALLNYDQHHQLAISYMNYASDINAGSSIYGQSIGLRGMWAIGVTYVNYGTFTEKTPDNSILGTFSANDIALTYSYSYELTDRLRAGASGKIIYSGYEKYSSWGIAVDLGLIYINPDHNLSTGISIRNIGGQIASFNEEHIKMPWDVSFGITHKLMYAPLRFSLTAQNLNRWNSKSFYENNTNNGDLIAKKDNFLVNLAKHFVIGCEFIPNANFYLAAGYNIKAQSDFHTIGKKGIYGFSFGGGFKIKYFQFDASFSQRNYKGGTLLVGLTTNLDKFRF